MYIARIYKLVNNYDCAIYIGSTKQILSKRFYKHKNNSKCFNYQIYQYVFENGNWDQWRIILIEEFKCLSQQDMLKKEQYYIDLYKNDSNYILLNQVRAYKTKEQKKEYIKQYQYNEKNKQYREKHKEQTKQYKKNIIKLIILVSVVYWYHCQIN